MKFRVVQLDPVFEPIREGILGFSMNDTCPGKAMALHRTGWACRVTTGEKGEFFLKTYFYPRLETLKGAFRTTFLSKSRVRKEAEALLWLNAHGLGSPKPIAYGEQRILGWLKRAWILTEFIPNAHPLTMLPSMPPEDARMAVKALGSWLSKAHGLGFLDGNPHLRNFLAKRRGTSGFEILKADSPKWRLFTGPVPGKARNLDLEIILQDMEKQGVSKDLDSLFTETYLGKGNHRDQAHQGQNRFSMEQRGPPELGRKLPSSTPAFPFTGKWLLSFLCKGIHLVPRGPILESKGFISPSYCYI